mgnify:FL=1
MSHGDYHCCCLCDNRLTYGGVHIESKDSICTYCAVKFALDRIIIRDKQEFIDFISTYPVDRLFDFLIYCNFKFCYYPNDVDEIIESKIGKRKEFER